VHSGILQSATTCIAAFGKATSKITVLIYLLAPNDPAFEALIQGDMAAIWSQINHKDLSAACPPLVMVLFRALAAVSPTAGMLKDGMLPHAPPGPARRSRSSAK
jgi:hypothetical protein